MRKIYKVMTGAATVCLVSLGGIQLAKAANTVALTADAVVPMGVTVDGEEVGGMTAKEVDAYVQNCVDEMLNKTLTVQTEAEGEPLVLNAADYSIEWENSDIVDEITDMIPTGNIIEKYKQIKDVEANPVDFELEFSIDEETLLSELSAYMEEHTIAVVEPSLKRENGSFIVTDGALGLEFDIEASGENVVSAMLDSGETETELVFSEVEPTVDKDVFANFKGDLLGSYYTKYEANNPDRDINVERGAELINGVVVLPGETFSMLDTLAPVTSENGFREAPVIMSGSYVDSIGGGLCQTTSTLYNAVFRSELQVTERRPHSKAGNYIAYSFDAMIYPNPYDPDDRSRDFCFVNNLENPIYIAAYCANKYVYCEIYGTEYRPSNRTVVYRQEILELSGLGGKNGYNFVHDPNLAVGDPAQLEGGWSSKTSFDSEPHFKVHSQMWKDVYVDGVLQEQILVNDDNYAGDEVTYYVANDVDINATTVTATMRPYVDGEYGGGVVNINIEFALIKRSQPVETKPAETKPAETVPVETTPAETAPAETSPEGTAPEETISEVVPIEGNAEEPSPINEEAVDDASATVEAAEN
ncbi:MAG: VanW family protein [Lachnospiraceae bacterium]